MIDIVRAAGRTAAALILASAAAAAPARAAENGPAAVAATTAAAAPGIGTFDEIVARANAAPAGTEAAAGAVPEIPVADAPARARPLPELVEDHASAEPRDAQADCLAAAVYFESNGEPLAGQLAVAEVIINRTRSGRFAPTLCGVITQRSQFSFVRGGRIPSPPRHSEAWRTAVAIAHIAMDDLADSPVSSALFFHARYVSPGWRLRRLATVGNHIFYR